MFWFSAALMLLTNIPLAAIPFTLKHAIDRGIERADISPIVFWLSIAMVVVLADLLISSVANRASIWAQRTLGDLRIQLFSHIQRQGLDFFHRLKTGTVISRLTNDVEALGTLVTDGIFIVFGNIVTIVVVEVFLFVLDWRLALATNTIMPFLIVITGLYRYFSVKAYRQTRERMAAVTAFIAEMIPGMRVVQSFAAEGRAAEQFEQTQASYRKANMDTIYMSAAYFPGVDFLSTVGTVIVLWYGGFLAQADLVTVGVLFAFLTYLSNVFEPVLQLSQFFSQFLSAITALEKVMEVMETKPTVLDRPDARRLNSVAGELEFRDVCFSYGGADGVEVLHNVSFSAKPGETIALIGPTGAGKSTIARLAARFYDPTSGKILLDGNDLRELDSRWLRLNLGIVPQEGFLFNDTVAANIRYGRPGATMDDVKAAAKAVGADDFIESLSDGYDTQVGERGGRLSAGQRQLICFARSLLADPSLLILDEATSSVDVETEERIAQGMTELVRGRTALVIAHRFSTVRRADRVLRIDAGVLVEAPGQQSPNPR